MSNFHNINFPHFLATHAKGGPYFATSHVITASGREIRSSNRTNALQQYVIEGCRLSREQFDEFNAFFRACLGSQYAFRLRDYADCLIKDQLIFVGNGTTKQFEVYKTYVSTTASYNRKITKLVIDGLQLVAGDVEIPHYMICVDTGIITLDSALMEGQRLILKNAVFDVSVRFNSDNFQYSMHVDGSIVIDNLHLMEVL